MQATSSPAAAAGTCTGPISGRNPAVTCLSRSLVQGPLGCTGREFCQRSAGEELSREASQGAVRPPTRQPQHQPARASFPLSAEALAR